MGAIDKELRLPSTRSSESPRPAASDKELRLPSSRLALVFGREDSGLRASEILCCTHCCTLATYSCGSLNLSHAVAVVLARLYEDRQADLLQGGIRASHLEREAIDVGLRPERPRTEQPCVVRSKDESGTAVDDNGDDEIAASTSEVDAVTERLKQLLESRGYPVGRTNKERHEKFCFRLMKHVAALTRLPHRAKASQRELQALQKLAELLAGEDPRVRVR